MNDTDAGSSPTKERFNQKPKLKRRRSGKKSKNNSSIYLESAVQLQTGSNQSFENLPVAVYSADEIPKKCLKKVKSEAATNYVTIENGADCGTSTEKSVEPQAILNNQHLSKQNETTNDEIQSTDDPFSCPFDSHSVSIMCKEKCEPSTRVCIATKCNEMNLSSFITSSCDGLENETFSFHQDSDGRQSSPTSGVGTRTPLSENSLKAASGIDDCTSIAHERRRSFPLTVSALITSSTEIVSATENHTPRTDLQSGVNSPPCDSSFPLKLPGKHY